MFYLNKSYIFMSMSVMILSSIMALSSTNWLFLWMAMEINMLSFIPLIVNSKQNQETEAAIKYFMAQALGSSIMLMSSMSMWFMSINSLFILLLLLSSLMLKLGMAPFHFWFPPVMTSISWMNCLILATWQKLAPLMILAFTMNNSLNTYMLFVAIMNSLIGGMMGMNQSHIRTIMAYSSITHMGWMASMLYVAKPLMTFIYYMMYCMIITPLFIVLNKYLTLTNKQFNKLNFSSPVMQMMIPLLLLSLSGIPPLTGFIPKWLAIYTVTMINPSLIIILIIGAMMNTYFYMNIVFNSMLASNSNTNFSTQFNMSYLNIPLIIAALSIFFLPILMFPSMYALIIFY